MLSEVFDNRALALASTKAHGAGVPLIVLFIISPDDYRAHDRSSRRIDFTLRNLKLLKVSVLFTQPMGKRLKSGLRPVLPRCAQHTTLHHHSYTQAYIAFACIDISTSSQRYTPVRKHGVRSRRTTPRHHCVQPS